MTMRKSKHTLTGKAPARGKYCLLAESGDCAAGAMFKRSSYIPFGPEHWTLIKWYLRNQLEIDLARAENDTHKLVELGEVHRTLADALIGIGVFHHKWHARTNWVVWELDESGVPMDWVGPIHRCDNLDPVQLCRRIAGCDS